MPKGVYPRSKLTKEQRKKRIKERQKEYQATHFKSHDVDEIRKLPTKDRNSVHVGFEGDFNLRIDVRVGPRLNEERHGYN